MERISEVLFGLIMVLSVTCPFSVAEADRKQVHGMLLAAGSRESDRAVRTRPSSNAKHSLRQLNRSVLKRAGPFAAQGKQAWPLQELGPAAG
jgi:hypothetical protein